MRTCAAAISGQELYTAEVFDACPELQVVVRFGVGVDTVDVDAATDRGVLVATIPGTTDGGVTDHAIGLMIDLAHGISRHDRAMRRGEWQPQRDIDMGHATAWATRLLGVPGPEPVTRALLAAVADLHTIAGAGAFDAGLYEHTMHHYTHALELATEAGDAYLQALALAYAGLATEEHGHPGDGLKMLQFAQVKSWDIPPGHDRRQNVEAVARSHAATALSRLGYPDAARTEAMNARELWHPKNPYGDPDRVAALLELDRGRLDAAEPFAAASVRRWEGGISELGRTHSSIVLATVHVRAGEPRGLKLAHGAITTVTKISSVRARRRLEPLAAALESRPGSDHRPLARMARHVATTRV